MIEIIPAILTNNPRELETLLSQAQEQGVKRVQIDIVDGEFADNKTIDPLVVADIETDLLLDFHLMTKEPMDWLEKAARGMADRVFGQIEMMQNQIAFVAKAQSVGVSVGLAVDLETPVARLNPTILTSIDAVLLMAVKAGFGGQKFNQKVVEKIKKLAKIRRKDKTPFKICVDGGVTPKVMPDLIKAGVDEVVVGRRLFEGDLKENIENFRKLSDQW